MSALSSKLGDVLNLGAGLDFGLALAPNMSVSACSSVSLCCVRSWPSTLSSLSLMVTNSSRIERIAFRITSKITCIGG